MKILITGASGFIGSFIVEEALHRGMETWAAVRGSSSKQYLKDERIHFIELNLQSREELEQQLQGHSFDYVVHAAGVTKCLKSSDFFQVNTEGTKNLVQALINIKMPIKRFVFISSLSVFGAIREKQPYQPIREDDTPQPNTNYGKSKLQAERFLESLECRTESAPSVECRVKSVEFLRPVGSKPAELERATAPGNGTHDAEANSKLYTLNSKLNDAVANSTLYTLHSKLPWVILRPTGVYGPREKDYFMMFKSIKQHSDFAVGYRQQDITFVYVQDVVQAVFLACEKGQTGRKYFLSDGQVYQSASFSNLIREELGHPWWLRIKAPIWVLRVVTWVGDWWGHVTGKVTALNNDKYHILKQRNWQCDIEPARRELGYEPKYQLEEGVRLSVKWYKENGWL